MSESAVASLRQMRKKSTTMADHLAAGSGGCRSASSQNMRRSVSPAGSATEGNCGELTTATIHVLTGCGYAPCSAWSSCATGRTRWRGHVSAPAASAARTSPSPEELMNASTAARPCCQVVDAAAFSPGATIIDRSATAARTASRSMVPSAATAICINGWSAGDASKSAGANSANLCASSKVPRAVSARSAMGAALRHACADCDIDNSMLDSASATAGSATWLTVAGAMTPKAPPPAPPVLNTSTAVARQSAHAGW
mmetsp:Transcript_11938/g.28952  ORF Transcript_11938/g.28952 Transcript_11938/m.28952 type:complete len:256 (-) Transcript_11938:398-1165(-)